MTKFTTTIDIPPFLSEAGEVISISYSNVRGDT